MPRDSWWGPVLWIAGLLILVVFAGRQQAACDRKGGELVPTGRTTAECQIQPTRSP